MLLAYKEKDKRQHECLIAWQLQFSLKHSMLIFRFIKIKLQKYPYSPTVLTKDISKSAVMYRRR